MIRERGTLHGGGLGHDRRPGQGPGRGSDHGHGSGRGRGHGHVPGRGKDSGSRGRGRGRASDAIYRSEHCSGSSVGNKLGGESPHSSAQSAGFLPSRPHKQPSLSGLHELLVGPRGISRGYFPAKKGADPNPSAFGNPNRRGGRLSWADMRRQSQHSNSTADDSSEPDGSHRSLLNFGGPGGGWGGRGRGRILDVSSVKKSDSGKDSIDANVWNGQGRGGILYVPGVDFHSGVRSTWWKRSGTSDQGTLNSRHSVGGCTSNYGLQSFQRKEGVIARYSKNKHQGWKKKTQKEECNNGAKTDNLRPIESAEKGDSHTQDSFVSCVQQSDKSDIENTQDVSSDLSCSNKQVIDIISLAEGSKEKLLHQRKNSDLNNIEENFQKQLIIRADDAVSIVPVNCCTEQNNERKETCKPGRYSPRGGRTQGIVLFGSSLVPDGAASDKQNAVSCGRDVEEKQSDPQIILKPENSCNDKACGAVM